MYQVKVTSHFDAAHWLRNYPGKCRNLHGHRFNFQVVIETGELKNGMAIDFVDIKKGLLQVEQILDHQYLNEITPFEVENPTAEGLAKYIFGKLVGHTGFENLKQVEVWESPECSAVYYES
jgi:6-pyruvoyltetrahydropterin/6-carboxytetrahydropterin synthase